MAVDAPRLHTEQGGGNEVEVKGKHGKSLVLSVEPATTIESIIHHWAYFLEEVDPDVAVDVSRVEMKDAGGRALDPGLSIGQLAQTDKGAGNIVLTPSRKPTEHEKEKQQIEHHLNSLPDPHYDKPGVSDLVVLWVHTTAKEIKQVNMLRHAAVEILISLAAGYEGTEDGKIRLTIEGQPLHPRNQIGEHIDDAHSEAHIYVELF